MTTSKQDLDRQVDALQTVGIHSARIYLDKEFRAQPVQRVLAYACSVHGVQGATADDADGLLTDDTDAAAAYVALTRGHYRNTVHISPAPRAGPGAVGRRGLPEPP